MPNAALAIGATVRQGQSQTMPKRAFSPGFRLSPVDVAVLVLAAALVVTLAFIHVWISGVIAFVVGHFFLFCNIIRMARPLELVWAGVFLTLAGGTVLFAMPPRPATYGLSLLTTAVVVAAEMKKPSYHGIGWQRINPQLRDWWKSNCAD